MLAYVGKGAICKKGLTSSRSIFSLFILLFFEKCLLFFIFSFFGRETSETSCGFFLASKDDNEGDQGSFKAPPIVPPLQRRYGLTFIYKNIPFLFKLTRIYPLYKNIP